MMQDPRDFFHFLRLRADVLKCCGNSDNLRIVELPGGVMLATCKVCGRRHRKVTVDPGVFNTKGSPLAH